MNGKAMITSKTFWTNAILGIAQVAGLLSGVLPPKAAAVTVTIQTIANFVLRSISDQPITGIFTPGPSVPPSLR